jgi:hypothetical protein
MHWCAPSSHAIMHLLQPMQSAGSIFAMVS